MNIPIFMHESNDSSQWAAPVFGPESSTRRQGDRLPMLAPAAEDSSAPCAASTSRATHLHPNPDTNQPTAAVSIAEQSVVYRFDQADYAALARRYSALLRRAVADKTLPTDRHLFCRRMIEELETTLTQFRAISGRNPASNARFDAEMELQWLCNQCEGFFGAAVSPELDTSHLNANATKANPAATDGELAAVSCLFAVSLAVAGGSTDRAAWRRHGGGALSIFGHRLREAFARTAVWLRQQAVGLRQQGAAVKALIRRADQNCASNQTARR